MNSRCFESVDSSQNSAVSVHCFHCFCVALFRFAVNRLITRCVYTSLVFMLLLNTHTRNTHHQLIDATRRRENTRNSARTNKNTHTTRRPARSTTAYAMRRTAEIFGFVWCASVRVCVSVCVCVGECVRVSSNNCCPVQCCCSTKFVL